jgi:ABC-2 type transport system ATP-binding protein
VGDLAGLAGPPGVLVDSPDRTALGSALEQAGLDPVADESGALLVRHDRTGAEVGPARVGAVAAAAGVALSHLSPSAARLEDAFLRTVTRAEHAQARAQQEAQQQAHQQAEQHAHQEAAR